MHVHDAIRTRRSIFQFKPGAIPDDLLEKILGFGVWAPNHLLTEPWRFTVLGEATHRLLAERYGELQVQKAPPDADAKLRELLRTSGIAKFLAKPTIVVVSCLQQGDEQRKLEDFAATCCAIQNIQLAGWAEGIGMQLSTNALIFDPRTYETLGIDRAQETIIGFLYMGTPDESPTRGRKALSGVMRRTP
jgi:nitroreductase